MKTVPQEMRRREGMKRIQIPFQVRTFEYTCHPENCFDDEIEIVVLEVDSEAALGLFALLVVVSLFSAGFLLILLTLYL